jgi:radical SAM peptide maturase (CXXX-repeat target family)
MSFETAKKFIDMILASDERTEVYMKSRECPGVTIDFIGGEPLLEIDLISDICDYFITQCVLLEHPWATRFRFSMSTNGVLYFDERVQRFIQKHKSHLWMNVTVDGTKEMHDMCRVDEFGNGSFDVANAAADDWTRRSGMTRGTKITIAPGNLSMCDEAILFFVKKNVKVINANCVFEDVWEKRHAAELYQRLKTIADYMLDNDLQDDFYISILDQPSGEKYPGELPWCGGSGLMLCVDPRGDFYPCVRYTPCSVGDGPKYILGNVDDGFTDLEKIKALSGVTRASQVAGTKCENCPISQGCADCAGYSYEVLGDIGRRTTFICDMHIARVLAQVYYRNKSFVKTGKKNPLPMNCPKEWAEGIVSEEEFAMLEEIAND